MSAKEILEATPPLITMFTETECYSGGWGGLGLTVSYTIIIKATLAILSLYNISIIGVISILGYVAIADRLITYSLLCLSTLLEEYYK